MRYKIMALLLLALLLSGCDAVEVVTPPGVVTPTQQVLVATVTPMPIPTPTPLSGQENDTSSGLQQIISVVFLPLLFLGILWFIMESLLFRYFRPRSTDISKTQVKTQDGLFMNTVISMTARKQLSLAAVTTRWDGVRSFVEKEIEQVLIQEATRLQSIDDLERRLRTITNDFIKLPIVNELSRDFGIEVIRFNIEPRYSQETVDALNRKAEAAAGGTAYLAFADAAELEPNSAECRELYTVYQETTGHVDAYRNLGGGITNLAAVLSPREQSQGEGDASND